MPSGVYLRRNGKPAVCQGDVYGRFTVRRVYREPRNNGYWREKAEVLCECGNTKHVYTDDLKEGFSQSCGCLQRELVGNRFRKHGLSNHPGYATWKHMLERCNSPSHPSYKDYGGRGIKVCDEWNPQVNGTALHNFINWFNSVNGVAGLTLERLDVNGNYEPHNCKLIPLPDQANNTRRTKNFTLDGETKNLVQWSRDPRCQVTANTIKYRLEQGLDFRTALTKPPLLRSEYRRGHDYGTNSAGFEW